ncbi:MAG TPA: prepilin-type N-terminal cleavage/methylation domain-containing protein [Nitrospirota bacterium]|nr:prepilin-type N-terminal cleavage/methylation domain-containing protein [Nitrospirota bacterium]
MKMKMKMKKKSKGFTLIELLIVVAIIAILAAIAIPQFSAYRIKGYDAAALADLRNARTAQEAFFSDWQVYASSAAGGAAGNGGRLLDNQNTPTSNSTGAIAQDGISASAPSAAIAAPGLQFGISQNVSLEANTSGAPNAGLGYTMATKNSNGDRCYGVDSDTSSIYWVNGSGVSIVGMAPASIYGADDFYPAGKGVAGGGACTGYPVANQGSTTWGPL